MVLDRTSVFPKAFTELAFGLSDVLKVAPFTFYQVLGTRLKSMAGSFTRESP